MKKLKSLSSLALAGVAVVMTGCSSTNMSSSDDGSAYRTVGAGGWVPITYASEMNKFPIDWNPVFYETYRMSVPVADAATSASVEADLADAEASMNVDLEPGSTFVEAAGADGETRVRRVILHTPFQQ